MLELNKTKTNVRFPAINPYLWASIESDCVWFARMVEERQGRIESRANDFSRNRVRKKFFFLKIHFKRSTQGQTLMKLKKNISKSYLLCCIRKYMKELQAMQSRSWTLLHLAAIFFSCSSTYCNVKCLSTHVTNE